MSNSCNPQLVLRGSAPHLEQLGLLVNGKSPYLMLNLPFACNYRCLKCCNQTTRPLSRPIRNPLSMNEICAVLDEAGKFGFSVLVLAGEGEPLLDRSLHEIVEAAISNGLLPYIFTNGSMLTPGNIRFLAKNRASLIINLDSLNASHYQRLSGGSASLRTVLDNISNCRAVYRNLQEGTASGKVVSVAINTVVTKINVGEVDDLARFCADDIVFVCNRPTRIGLAEENWSMLFGMESDSSDSAEQVIDRYSQANGPLGTASDGLWCSYMKHGVSVGFDGNFLACAYAIDTAGYYGFYSEGNLRTANELIMRSVNEFYLKAGHSRCVLRHPQYQDWLFHLRAHLPQMQKGT